MATFYLIRHGEKDADERLIVGRANGIHLTPRGRKQGEAIATHLETRDIQQVYSSPRERAQETAVALARSKGVAVQLSEALEEFDFGDWSGKTLDELSALVGWRQFNAFRSGSRPPRGETMIEVQTRFVAEMLRLQGTYPDAGIALVSHGDPIRAAVSYFLGTPLDLFQRIEISLGSISVIHLDADHAVVLRLNDVPPEEAGP